MTKYNNESLKEMLAITKALADENRIRIVMALCHEALCVCQITELLKLATSTVSKHVAILKQAGLLDARKEGRWIYYQVPDSDLPAEIARIITLLTDSLGKDKRIRADRQRLKELLKIDREVLCRSM